MLAQATPKKMLKTTIWSTSLVAIASTTLLGKRCSMKVRMVKPFAVLANSLAELVSAARLRPTPGSRRFTSTMPNKRETSDALMNQSNARPPTRPTVFISPSLAMPTTSVLNTSGAMIIFTSRRKMSVRIFRLSATSLRRCGLHAGVHGIAHHDTHHHGHQDPEREAIAFR
jgi:hypothetical protein